MAVLPFPCLLPYFRPQDLLLSLPFPSVLEQMFPRLCPVLAPPAGRAVCVFRPLQVLPSAAVPRSELVKASRQVLRRSLHHPVWLLVSCQLVLPSPDPFFSPAPCFAPLLLCYFPPQIGQGPGWGHPPYPVLVPIPQPLHSPGIRLLCCLLRPLIRFLISLHSFVGRAPSDFNAHLRPRLL